MSSATAPGKSVVAVADRVDGVGVAIAYERQPQLRGDAGGGGTSVSPRGGGVVALQGVPVDERILGKMDA